MQLLFEKDLDQFVTEVLLYAKTIRNQTAWNNDTTTLAMLGHWAYCDLMQHGRINDVKTLHAQERTLLLANNQTDWAWSELSSYLLNLRSMDYVMVDETPAVMPFFKEVTTPRQALTLDLFAANAFPRLAHVKHHTEAADLYKKTMEMLESFGLSDDMYSTAQAYYNGYAQGDPVEYAAYRPQNNRDGPHGIALGFTETAIMAINAYRPLASSGRRPQMAAIHTQMQSALQQQEYTDLRIQDLQAYLQAYLEIDVKVFLAEAMSNPRSWREGECLAGSASTGSHRHLFLLLPHEYAWPRPGGRKSISPGTTAIAAALRTQG